MKRSFFLASCAGVLVGAMLTATILHNRVAPSPPPAVRADDTRTAVGLTTTFAPIVKRVTPAVVNISSTRVVKAAASPEGMPMDDFFRQFFGGGFSGRLPQRPTERRS